MAATTPSIQPSPSVGAYSSPSRAISCMPTQMPRNGPGLDLDRLAIAANAPGPRERAAQAGKGAVAGQHDPVGPGDHLRVRRHHDRPAANFGKAIR